MTSEDISIVMATRNVRGDLDGALDSIEAFAPDCPLYVWDARSTDGTQELLKQHDPLITRWESGEDTGIYDAFQKALQWVETPFVYFLGADDRLRSDWRMVAEEVHDTSKVYYSDVWLCGKNKRYNGEFSQMDLARTNICQQAIFYPTHIFTKHPFCMDYPLQADWELNMWCQAQKDLELSYVDGCVCDFNDTSGSSSTSYDQVFNRDYPRLLRRYFPFQAFVTYGVIAGLAHHTRKFRGVS